MPIPYQKSCKIVADKGWGDYYHFAYATFPKGTQVPTFKRELSAEEKAALEAADEVLGQGLGTDPAGKRDGEDGRHEAATVAAGQGAIVVATLDGPRAITAIRAK